MKAIVTVIGKDRVGIIADVCAILAANGVNVLDISQTVMQDYFTMIMMVDTAQCRVRFNELSDMLAEEGEKTALTIRIQRSDIFEAMHRI
ncbi:MAG: ACT domain-containing protein [Oscillospiraceae bacterium]|nr:ACT domain-containing protein [Oscillospiraceae bacterium]